MPLPGLPDPALGVVFGVAWLLLLGGWLVRYSREAGSASGSLALAASGLLWLSYSLLQVGDALDGPAETATVAGSVVLFVAGLLVGVRWWQARNGGGRENTATPGDDRG